MFPGSCIDLTHTQSIHTPVRLAELSLTTTDILILTGSILMSTSGYRRKTRSKALKSPGPDQVGSQEMPSLVESARTTEDTTPTSADQLRAVLGELTHLDLTGRVTIDRKNPKAGGGFCDVYIGYVRGRSSNTKVAVRELRTFIMLERDFKKMLAKEVKIWSALDHINLLPLYGFICENRDKNLVNFSFISEWMENGTADKYVRTNPDCDIVLLIHGIADGLAYLHRKNIIHGDLKANNVLISNSFPRQALICDFGISRAIMTSSNPAVSSSLTGSPAGSLRWMARELLDPSVPTPDGSDITRRQSQKTDVWSFGMTVYELLTRQIPFFHILEQDAIVMGRIIKGELPILAKELTEPFQISLWKLCRDCWEKNPDDRPGMEAIIGRLVHLNAFDHKHFTRHIDTVRASLERLDMTDNVDLARDQYSSCGDLAAVYEARTLRQTSVDGEEIPSRLAVKVYHLQPFSKESVRRASEELIVWSTLSHKNVMKLLGYIHPQAGSNLTDPALVSKWMENGTAREYIKANPNCEIVSIILGAAEGLAYLHYHGVIHGNINGSNILISDSGQALLSGFGHTHGYSSSSVHTLSVIQQQSTAYGPVFGGSITSSTAETDVWSFGKVICELLTNDGPYATCDKDTQVIKKFNEDLTPDQSLCYAKWPPLHRCLWEIAKDCCNLTSKLQPTMKDIVILLKEFMATDFSNMPQEPETEIHSYLKSDKYGFVPLAWDISMPPSSALLYADRGRKDKETTLDKELRSPFTLPASTDVNLILPHNGQTPVKASSSEAVTVEDIMQSIYEYYHRKIDIRNIPLRRRAEIRSDFKTRCDAPFKVGEFESGSSKVKERGICKVDLLEGKVMFEALTFSTEHNAWELHLMKPQE